MEEGGCPAHIPRAGCARRASHSGESRLVTQDRVELIEEHARNEPCVELSPRHSNRRNHSCGNLRHPAPPLNVFAGESSYEYAPTSAQAHPHAFLVSLSLTCACSYQYERS